MVTPPNAGRVIATTSRTLDHTAAGEVLQHAAAHPLRDVGDKSAHVSTTRTDLDAARRSQRPDDAPEATSDVERLRQMEEGRVDPTTFADPKLARAWALLQKARSTEEWAREALLCIVPRVDALLPVNVRPVIFHRAVLDLMTKKNARSHAKAIAWVQTTVANEVREAVGRTLPEVDAAVRRAVKDRRGWIETSDLGPVRMPTVRKEGLQPGPDHLTGILRSEPRWQKLKGLTIEVLVMGDLRLTTQVEVKGPTNVGDGVLQHSNLEPRLRNGWLEAGVNRFYTVEQPLDVTHILVAPYAKGYYERAEKALRANHPKCEMVMIDADLAQAIWQHAIDVTNRSLDFVVRAGLYTK